MLAVCRVEVWVQEIFFVKYTNGICRRQLKLPDILQIVWLWVYSRMTMVEAAEAAGVAKNNL